LQVDCNRLVTTPKNSGQDEQAALGMIFETPFSSWPAGWGRRRKWREANRPDFSKDRAVKN